MNLQPLLLFTALIALSLSHKIPSSNETSHSQQLRDRIIKFINGSVALRMFDASGKLPSGVLRGNFFDLGDFDECLAIQSGNVYGKYCLGTLHISGNVAQSLGVKQIPIKPEHWSGLDMAGLHIAACIPSNMNASSLPGPLLYTEDFCYTKLDNHKFSPGAVVTVGVLLFFLALVLLSTGLDHYSEYNKKEFHKLLLAFSVLSNGRKIMISSINPDRLSCLNGLRAISMMWVVLGHEYINALNAPLANMFDIPKWQSNPVNMIINGATLSVDSFFVIGGLLIVYTYLKAIASGIEFTMFHFYMHRIFRLMPGLSIMVLVYMFLLPYVGDGPLWKVVEKTLSDNCKITWWSTLLFIGNYLQKGFCLPHTWYLSVDMQLFVLSPLILLPLSKTPKVGLTLLGSLVFAGLIIPLFVSYVDNLRLSSYDLSSYMRYLKFYYYEPYTRFGPYVIGMFLGYTIYQIKSAPCELFLRPLIVWCLWTVSLFGLTACVFSGYAKGDDLWSDVMFIGFNRSAWAVALSILIFLCVAGYGGPIDWFLSLPIFQFLSKISYSIYLVHYAIIVTRYCSMRHVFEFSNGVFMRAFWGDFMLTLVLSLPLCLAFESPVIVFEKYLLAKKSTEKTTKQV